MVANFHVHEAAFQRLLELQREDRGCPRGGSTFTRPDGLPESRWGEYRALFAATGLRDGVSTLPNGQVQFEYWAIGLLNGDYKGYVYSPEPLGPLVDSLDDGAPGRPNATAYKQIAEHWYLYYSETS